MAIPRVAKAKHLGDFRVDPFYFACFEVDDTLVWPNGADFAPEFLHESARMAAKPAGPPRME